MCGFLDGQIENASSAKDNREAPGPEHARDAKQIVGIRFARCNIHSLPKPLDLRR